MRKNDIIKKSRCKCDERMKGYGFGGSKNHVLGSYEYCIKCGKTYNFVPDREVKYGRAKGRAKI